MAAKKEELPANIIKISPSSFSFDWKECRRCYWLKHRAGVVRPSKPMAAIYTKIDGAMRAFYAGRTIVRDGIELVVDTKVRFLRSAPFFVNGYEIGVLISGKNDALATPREPGDLPWAHLPDFKTSEPKPENVPLYANQLEGYAYCLEHPEDPTATPIEVRGLELLIFTPMAYQTHIAEVDGSRALTGNERPLPIPRDRAGFERFLTDVVVLLNQPAPPPPNGICAFCEMDRETARAATRVQVLEAEVAHLQLKLNRQS